MLTTQLKTHKRGWENTHSLRRSAKGEKAGDVWKPSEKGHSEKIRFRQMQKIHLIFSTAVFELTQQQVRSLNPGFYMQSRQVILLFIRIDKSLDIHCFYVEDDHLRFKVSTGQCGHHLVWQKRRFGQSRVISCLWYAMPCLASAIDGHQYVLPVQ